MLTKKNNAGVNIAFQCIHIVITMTTIELQWLNKHMNTSSTTTKKKTNSHKKTRIQTRIVLKYQLTYNVLFSNICLQIYNHLSTSYNTNQQQPATTSNILHPPVTIWTSNNQQQITYNSYNTNQQQPAADYIHQLQYEPATTSSRLHTPVTIRTSNNQRQITCTF